MSKLFQISNSTDSLKHRLKNLIIPISFLSRGWLLKLSVRRSKARAMCNFTPVIVSGIQLNPQNCDGHKYSDGIDCKTKINHCVWEKVKVVSTPSRLIIRFTECLSQKMPSANFRKYFLSSKFNPKSLCALIIWIFNEDHESKIFR